MGTEVSVGLLCPAAAVNCTGNTFGNWTIDFGDGNTFTQTVADSLMKSFTYLAVGTYQPNITGWSVDGDTPLFFTGITLNVSI